jgi:hypothetical protein
VNINQAIADYDLFRPYLADRDDSLATWRNWRTALRVLYGLGDFTDEAAEVINACTGRDASKLANNEFDTALFLTGRRSGKSRIAAVVGAFEAVLSGKHKLLAPGEVGYVPIVSPSRNQSKVVRDYLVKIFDTPMLRNEVVRATKENFELRNGVRIEILTGDYRRVRGFTLLAAVDVQRLTAVAPKLVEAVIAGNKIEISTGLYTLKDSMVGEQQSICNMLQEELDACRAELEDVDTRIANTAAGLQEIPKEQPRTREKALQESAKLEQKYSKLQELERELEGRLANAETDSTSFKQWQANLATLQKAIEDPDASDVRQQLNAHLRRLIEKVEVFTHGHRYEWDSEKCDGDAFGELILECCSPKSPEWDFLQDVAARRFTKEGRFVRVHFKQPKAKVVEPKPGKVRHRRRPIAPGLDFVPASSLASGYELDQQKVSGVKKRDSWKAVSPALADAWESWKKAHTSEE